MPTAVILGASSDRSKYGNKSVRAHQQMGYTVYPVNPKGGEIEGLKVYRSLDEVPPGKLDRISLYLPPAVGIGALDDIAKRGCEELWLNPGSDSPQVVEKASSLGLNVVQACSIVDLGVSPGTLTE
jgi:predicted CoA-binding protein